MFVAVDDVIMTSHLSG